MSNRRRDLCATVCCLVAACVAGSADDAYGQQTDESGGLWLTKEFAVLSGNALAGGIAAGVHALLTGSDADRAFLRGALGGAVGFAGKSLAVRIPDIAYAGRAVSVIGNSIVSQAPAPGRILESVTFPYGPLRAHLSWRAGMRVRISLAAYDIALLAQGFADRDLRFDWERSAALGAAVFLTEHEVLARDEEAIGGIAMYGNLVLLDGVRSGQADDSFDHEIAHVLQFDFIEAVLNEPLESTIRRGLHAERYLPSWLRFNVTAPLLYYGLDQLQGGDPFFHHLIQEEANWLGRD